jgi:hypothetical protein
MCDVALDLLFSPDRRRKLSCDGPTNSTAWQFIVLGIIGSSMFLNLSVVSFS